MLLDMNLFIFFRTSGIVVPTLFSFHSRGVVVCSDGSVHGCRRHAGGDYPEFVISQVQYLECRLWMKVVKLVLKSKPQQWLFAASLQSTHFRFCGVLLLYACTVRSTNFVLLWLCQAL